MTFVSAIEPPDQDAPQLHFVVHKRGLVVRREGETVRMLDEAEASAVRTPGPLHFLGTLDGKHAFASPAEGEIGEPYELAPLRGLYFTLGEQMFAVAGRAAQLVDWAATHRFCGRCATPTERTKGERAMRCPACELVAYPRIAPAIITLVRKGDLALLAHGARFPMPFYSTLAGFVEAGETLEETLVREVREEVGIEVEDIRYFGSQSWPFPNSLMLGFFASWKSGEIVPEPSEILDAKWFRADELPMIPPVMSISRKLIDVWLREVRGA